MRARVFILTVHFKNICLLHFFDEATPLDVDNQILTKTFLSCLIADKTVLAIVYKKRTVVGVDKIVVFSDDTVAERRITKGFGRKEWCVCSYGKTANRKLQNCMIKLLKNILLKLKE